MCAWHLLNEFSFSATRPCVKFTSEPCVFTVWTLFTGENSIQWIRKEFHAWNLCKRLFKFFTFLLSSRKSFQSTAYAKRAGKTAHLSCQKVLVFNHLFRLGLKNLKWISCESRVKLGVQRLIACNSRCSWFGHLACSKRRLLNEPKLVEQFQQLRLSCLLIGLATGCECWLRTNWNYRWRRGLKKRSAP